MDRVKIEYKFIIEIWKFMKNCETSKPHDDDFWVWAENTGEAIARRFEDDLPFVGEWLGSYLVFLGRCDEGRI